MAPPWKLEYANKSWGDLAKAAVEAAVKGAVEVAVKEAAEAVQQGAAEAAEKTETADKAAENPYASKWYKDKDRATDEQRAKAIKHLEDQGFTDIRLPENGVFFGQNDKSRWGEEPYPKGGNPPYTEGGPKRAIGDAGCAPAAVAIADAILRGTKTTPPEVAAFAVANKASGNPPRSGSHTARLAKEWAREHNLNHEHTKAVDDVRKGLERGGVAVVNVKGGIFNQRKFNDSDADPPGGGGHEIVVIGYATDKDGKEWFFVSNPGKDASVVNKGNGLVVEDTPKPGLHHGAGRVRVSRDTLEKYMKNGAHILSNP